LNKIDPDVPNLKPDIYNQRSIVGKTKFGVLSWLIVIAYTSAVGITEFVLFYVSVPGGVALYFAILIALLFQGTFERNDAKRDLWLALGLVPLIRIVSTVTSAIEFTAIIRYILIGMPVFAGIYIMARHLKYRFDDIGLNNRHLFWQILTAITGIGLGMIDYLILRPKPLVEGSVVQFIIPGLVLLIFSGFMEELAFRGLLQRAAGALGSWGWAIIAPIYALLQIGHGSLFNIIFTLGVALFFGFVVMRTKSILGVSVAHGILNIMLFLAMVKIV
jgi:membrane protease YdiL (CAAX protease family)